MENFNTQPHENIRFDGVLNHLLCFKGTVPISYKVFKYIQLLDTIFI